MPSSVLKLNGKRKMRCLPKYAQLFSILLTFRGSLQAAALIRPSVEPPVFVKSLHILKNCDFYLHCPP